jgi:hypothetical protein
LILLVGVARIPSVIIVAGIQLKIPDSRRSSGLFYFYLAASKLAPLKNKKSHAYARDFLLSG